ncbi:MAG TPA: hypothetical protein VF522_17930 [Ramlibacter sp.]|uniref:hypothetical protein n=1 Tax=Ramlibacter sp. TaxID=1917967 RepID=UPI002ED1A95C
MRKLHQFSAGEWLRLVPFGQAFRQVRNHLLLRHYRHVRPPQLAEFLARHHHLKGGRVAIVIAFRQPWSLDWQLQMAARYLPGTELLVFDNSGDEGIRREIQRVCDHHQVSCFGLPPYQTAHVNRSHGMAMSWVYHNVVRALRPDIFGFLDHDLIPMEPVDVDERLRGQPVYGVLNAGNLGHWSLWAGYCFYRFAYTEGKPLNFLYDFSRQLDTGGHNWDTLYSVLPRADLRFAPQQFLRMQPPAAAESRQVEVIDGAWIHMGGISYNDNFQRKHAFFASMKKAIDGGAGWRELEVF